MAFPAECPICKTVLEFPETGKSKPVRCPNCDTRFIIEGQRATRLSYTDYYDLLDISRGADQEQIRKAIRAKIKELHPDRNPGDPHANDRIREVIQARELLTDERKRATYDEIVNARVLPRWESRRRKTTYQKSGGSATRERSRSRWEEVIDSARAKSRRTSNQDIEHLINEIEEILSRGYRQPAPGSWFSLPFQLRLPPYAWKLTGAIIGIIAGTMFAGMMKARGVGYLLIMGLSGLAGWVIVSLSREIVSLAFFLARNVIAGILLTFIAARLATGEFNLTPFAGDIRIFIVSTIIGGVILGILRLGAGAIEGEYFLREKTLAQAGMGAWIGSVIGVAVVMTTNAMEEQIVRFVLSWWAMFSIFLFLDYQLFGRPVIFVYR